jgi:hypothetical protein
LNDPGNRNEIPSAAARRGFKKTEWVQRKYHQTWLLDLGTLL